MSVRNPCESDRIDALYWNSQHLLFHPYGWDNREEVCWRWHTCESMLSELFWDWMILLLFSKGEGGEAIWRPCCGGGTLRPVGRPEVDGPRPLVLLPVIEGRCSRAVPEKEALQKIPSSSQTNVTESLGRGLHVLDCWESISYFP